MTKVWLGKHREQRTLGAGNMGLRGEERKLVQPHKSEPSNTVATCSTWPLSTGKVARVSG